MTKLPEELKSILDKSRKEYVKITCDKRKTVTIYNSKFGGDPYFPKEGFEYPVDDKGNSMKLLAQINFDEVPNIKDLPKQGILQFYIQVSDDWLYGLDFDDGRNQDKFRIIYFKDIELDESKLMNDFSFITSLDDDNFPVKEESGLDFKVLSQEVSQEDYQFVQYFGGTIDEVCDKYGDEIEKYYDEVEMGVLHKIGGYGYFTQCDPRDYDERYIDYNFLLLQIDSDYDNKIWWGDSGVANFFISREKLQKLDFSDVLYNWDCC